MFTVMAMQPEPVVYSYILFRGHSGLIFKTGTFKERIDHDNVADDGPDQDHDNDELCLLSHPHSILRIPGQNIIHVRMALLFVFQFLSNHLFRGLDKDDELVPLRYNKFLLRERIRGTLLQ